MDQRHGIILPFLILFFMVGVQSSGKMTILLLNYRNSGHKVFNGDCCDNLNFCSWNDCDNLFKFCATALGSTVSCSLSGGQLTTGILGDDDFSFPGQGGYLGGGLNNPITFSFQEWKGVSVAVEIWDDDGGFIVGKLADFVDKYTLIETTAPESNKSSSRPRDKKLCGKRSCTNVKIRVYCDDHYLIPECTEYCVPRDSDEEGHYWCDYDLGRKVCHEGWYDALTNCTKKKKECTPRNDTIGGHYDCDQESGEKICLSGWMGNNCTQVYVSYSVTPSSSSKGINIKSTSLHQSTIQGLTFTSATNTEVHPTPSLNIHPTISEDLKNTRTSLDTSVSYESSPTRPTTMQNVEHKSTSTPNTILPSIMQYSTTSKLSQFTSVAVTKETRKETSHYIIQSSAPSIVRESSSFRVRTSSLHSTLLVVATVAEVGPSYKTPTSTSLQYTTREMLLEFSTTAVRSSVAVPSSVESTLIVPTTEWNNELVLNVSPGKNWTEEKKNKLKSAITDQVNKYCMAHPTSCNIDPNVVINRTEFLNTSDVIIVVKNVSSDAIVSVQVKLPSKIPGISGGGTLPSVVLKKVITANKNTIEKQIGLKVSLEAPSSTTTSQPTTQSTTDTDTVVVITSTPLSSFTPWNLWIYILGSCGACLLLLGATLGFAKYKMNRQNKIHVLDDSPERKERMARKEEEEMVCLSNTQPLISTKNTLKVKFQETVLRVRTSSVNSDKSILYSPFTPDYTRS